MNNLLCRLGLATALISGVPALAQSFDTVEPRAGTWKTWVLSSGSELRVAKPPGWLSTLEEVHRVKQAAAQCDAACLQQVRYWDAGAPPYRWIEMLSSRMRDGRLGVSITSFRGFGLLSAAMYDATVAAWDSKYTYRRRRPYEFDFTLRPVVAIAPSPSYPSEHAVVAGAAAAVLAYLFPEEAARFEALAEEAGRSRVNAKAHFPSDVSVGLELGRAVGRRVVEYARGDRTDTPWMGTIPTGPGYWTGVNPGFATAPQWKPWFLDSPDAFRPPPPPAYNSPEKLAEISELKTFPRTFASNAAAFFWQTGEGIHTWFYDEVHRKLFESGLDRNAPWAARAYALVAMVHYDSHIASNDGKYTYWAARPSQLDAGLTTLFANPNHPSYPSNHSTHSSARAEIMAYLFPDEAAYFRAKGEEAGLARLWAGIHYRSDHEAGVTIGKGVARKLIEIAERDGSSPR